VPPEFDNTGSTFEVRDGESCFRIWAQLHTFIHPRSLSVHHTARGTLVMFAEEERGVLLVLFPLLKFLEPVAI